MKQVAHEIKCGKLGQCRIKVENDRHVNSCALQKTQLLMEAGKQLGLVVGMEYFTRMLVKSDDH